MGAALWMHPWGFVCPSVLVDPAKAFSTPYHHHLPSSSPLIMPLAIRHCGCEQTDKQLKYLGRWDFRPSRVAASWGSPRVMWHFLTLPSPPPPPRMLQQGTPRAPHSEYGYCCVPRSHNVLVPQFPLCVHHLGSLAAT